MLGKELKAQTDFAKKQYQKLHNTFKFNKIIEKEKLTLRKYNKSNLIYDSKCSPYPYLLDYDYIKNDYRLIAVDLSRQKELDTGPKVI